MQKLWNSWPYDRRGFCCGSGIKCALKRLFLFLFLNPSPQRLKHCSIISSRVKTNRDREQRSARTCVWTCVLCVSNCMPGTGADVHFSFLFLFCFVSEHSAANAKVQRIQKGLLGIPWKQGASQSYFSSTDSKQHNHCGATWRRPVFCKRAVKIPLVTWKELWKMRNTWWGRGADDRRASLMTVTLNGCRLGKMLRVSVPLIQQKKQEKTFLSHRGCSISGDGRHARLMRQEEREIIVLRWTGDEGSCGLGGGWCSCRKCRARSIIWLGKMWLQQ